jgi:mono/diheme cytochrome c family protein
MSTATSTIFGLIFLGLGNASVFLMYKLWGYPFDHETRASAAPKSLMFVHRAIGYAYLILYIFMMWYMVPRLWNYQVELPPRTVAHLMLGITIGVLLLVKISILRFFRHFEEAMPYIGTALLICTYLLIGLSVPFTLRESVRQVSSSVFSDASIERTHTRLQMAGLPPDAPLDKLATRRKLREGQDVLLKKCVQCHDLRTILARPRTPPDWVRTVDRMAIKPMIGEPITLEDQWTVSAYLIAITPELQVSAKEQRKQRMQVSQAQDALAVLTNPDEVADEVIVNPDEVIVNPDEVIVNPDEVEEIDEAPAEDAYDPDAARELFEITCSLCHDLSDVDNVPPTSEEETTELIVRMIDNGLFLEEEDIKIIARYMNETYVNP